MTEKAEPEKDPLSELKQNILQDKLSVLEPKLSARIPPETAVQEVIQVMVDKKIGAVLIVENHRLIGIFSERDIIMRIGTRMNEIRNQPIQDYMTHNPESLSMNHTLAYALNRMADCDFRHIPILDEEEVPTGIVAVRDVLRYIDHHCLDGPP